MEKYKKGNLTLTIEQDDERDCNPREWDNLGIMFCQHNRYDLGDKNDIDTNNFNGWEDVESYLKKEKKAILISPLYLYDHSGLSIKIGSFQGLLTQGHAEFDSGQVGFIYTTEEAMKECYQVKKITKTHLDKAKKLLIGEVHTYNQHLTGDVWGFTITKNKKCGTCGHIEKEVVDSCWGFFGSDIKENGMLDHIGKEWKKTIDNS